MSADLLVVERLEASYGRAEVLFGLSLSVGPGEVVALLGRNGAGKSTTMRAIMGLVDRRAQRLSFDGHDIARLAPHRIARLGVGYVPEERRIFTGLTVAENLEVGRRAPAAGAAAWTPERLFTLFPNLAELSARKGGAMSGGEQQMLTIARTLMGNPRLVLLDEPSEGLSPRIAEMMAEAVLKLKSEGLAVLLSEQNLHFARHVADRAIVIERGNVRFTGTMAELDAKPHIKAEHLSL